MKFCCVQNLSLCVAVCVSCAAVSGEVRANSVNSFIKPDRQLSVISPSTPSQSDEISLPKPEALFTDLFGVNTWLRKRGIAIGFDNTNEMAGMIHAPTAGYGLRQGASNAGQYSLSNDIDWGMLAGWAGLSTHSVIVGRYGTPVSKMFGDTLIPSQEIYGGGGNVVVHFVYLYAEQKFFQDNFNIAAGRMSFLSDFSNNTLYCNFMNNAFCGNPKAAGDNPAHSSYPDSSWAIRLRVRPTKNTLLQFGLYFTQTQAIYTNDQMRTGFKFNGATVDGEAMPVEFTWIPDFGWKHNLSGHYKVGFVYDTADHLNNYYDRYGNPFALSGFAAREDHGSWSTWVLVDQMLYHHVGQPHDSGITLIGDAYFNKPQTQTRAAQYTVGIFDRGFWNTRTHDAFGVNFSYTQISGDLTRTERLYYLQGRSIPNGALFPQTSEYNLEAFYQCHVFRGITFSPDFQYYFKPGGQKQLKNQALIGFKSHIQLF